MELAVKRPVELGCGLAGEIFPFIDLCTQECLCGEEYGGCPWLRGIQACVGGQDRSGETMAVGEADMHLS